ARLDAVHGLALECTPDAGADHVAPRRRDAEPEVVLTDRLSRRPPEHAHRLAIELHDAPVASEDDDDAARDLDERPVALGAGPRVAMGSGEDPPLAEVALAPALAHGGGDDRGGARGRKAEQVGGETRVVDRMRPCRRGHVVAE